MRRTPQGYLNRQNTPAQISQQGDFFWVMLIGVVSELQELSLKNLPKTSKY